MKRTTVIFLALAILLAHTLAIHQTSQGEFAAPYDIAHVAFRLGRNLVHSGLPTWDPLGAPSEAYPSLLWVLLSALAELLRIFPTTLAQIVGVSSALLTVGVLAQFSPNRLVGLTAPVLLACSGSIAAAGAGGTEAASAMLFVTLAFLAYERRWAKLLSASMLLLLITRPEGVVVFGLLFLMEFLDRSRERDDEAPWRPLWRAYVIPILIIIGSMGLRQWAFGEWISPLGRSVLSFDSQRIALGAEYALSFLRCSGSAPILILPLLMILVGRLKGRGRRSLLLFFGWMGYVVLSGGDGLPFWNALVPTLPLAFLSVQAALSRWIDRYPRQAPLASVGVVAALLASLLASKLPGDLGSIPLERMLHRWMQPSEASAEVFPHSLGREGQWQEIRHVDRMRTTGLFFVREARNLGDSEIATFWPGALGYLSRRRVIDLLGRVTPASGQNSQSWRGQPKVDLVAALQPAADYLVLDTDENQKLSITDRLHLWLSRYDSEGDTDERFRLLLGVLRHFELVSVPVPLHSAEPDVLSPKPFLLLRKRSLNLAPQISIKSGNRAFKVFITHHGHRQVGDLVMEWLGADGERWTLSPNGVWVQDQELRARANILIYDTGNRPFQLIADKLPVGFKQGTLRAHLLSPNTMVGDALEKNFESLEVSLP